MLFSKALVPSAEAWKAGLRVAVAGGLAYAIAEYFNLAEGFWAVVTAVIIMQQPRVGGTLKAGVDRFIGTFVGALFGFVVASITPSTTLGTGIGLIVSVGVLGMLASGRQSYRVAPLTAAIVLISPTSHAVAWISALHRVIEILVGCVIAMVVSLVVAPTRSDTSMREESRHALSLLARLTSLALDKQEGTPTGDEIAKLNKEIDTSFREITTISKELHEEVVSHFSKSSLDPTCLRLGLIELRTAVTVLLNLAQKPWPASVRDAMVGPTRSVTEAICDYMLALGDRLTAEQAPPPKDDMNTAFVAFSSSAEAVVETWRTRSVTAAPGKGSKEALADPPALDQGAPSYISNVYFALEQLRAALVKLAECADGTSDGAARPQ